MDQFVFVMKLFANDVLLSLFITNRKVANGSQYPFGVFRLPVAPMTANGKILPLVTLVKLRTYPVWFIFIPMEAKYTHLDNSIL